MARAALAGAGDVAATRDVAAAVAPAVRRLAAEATAAKLAEGGGEAVPRTPTPKPGSAGLVPRALQKKRAEASARARPPAPRLTPGAARAAALAEATLVAALASVPAAIEGRSGGASVPDARVGAAAIRARRETRALREGVDAAVAALRDSGAFSRVFSADPDGSGRFEVEAAASALAAAGVSARLAELCARHADARASRDDPPDADATRVCATTAARALALYALPSLEGGPALGAEPAAVAAASATAACVGLLDATGPALDAHAHAALLATVVAAYDAAARRAAARADDERVAEGEDGTGGPAPALPAPSRRLALALESVLESLTRGTGKRPLGAGYRAAIERLRDVDGACRRRTDVRARDVAARVAAPLWLLRALLGGGGAGSAAARAAHAETAFDACVAPARHVSDSSAACVSDQTDARLAMATAGASLRLSTALASRRGAPLSARCAARMAATPSSLATLLTLDGAFSISDGTAETGASSSSCAAVCVSAFVPACDLLTAILRTRTREMRRSAALVVASCATLLDALRAWHARRAPRGDGGGDAFAGGERTARVSAGAESVDWACRRGGAALACVYEEAAASGMDRYCAHLLADAVTCASGGDAGVGPAASGALKPGMFALVDACGDRELGQIHAAFGSQAGGARRVALAALVEEHKRAHKYDGKV